MVVLAPETRLRDIAMHPLGDANQQPQPRRAIIEDLTFHSMDPMRSQVSGRPEAQNQLPEGMLILWNQAYRLEALIVVVTARLMVSQQKEYNKEVEF